MLTFLTLGAAFNLEVTALAFTAFVELAASAEAFVELAAGAVLVASVPRAVKQEEAVATSESSRSLVNGRGIPDSITIWTPFTVTANVPLTAGFDTLTTADDDEAFIIAVNSTAFLEKICQVLHASILTDIVNTKEAAEVWIT